MKAPNLFTPKSFFDLANSCYRQTGDGRWVTARPLGFYSLWWRLKLSYGVLVGKYDAMSWPKEVYGE